MLMAASFRFPANSICHLRWCVRGRGYWAFCLTHLAPAGHRPRLYLLISVEFIARRPRGLNKGMPMRLRIFVTVVHESRLMHGYHIKMRCPWCSRYRRRKWTRRYEFKSWIRLIAFHIALIPLGKVWIQ